MRRIIAATLLILGFQYLQAFAVDSAQNKGIFFAPLPSEIDFILEFPQRNALQQPDRVIETMAVKQGEHVADVGAGSGFFTFRLADKVGIGGKIYAADIQEGMLDYIRKKAETNKVDNIVLVKSSESDANLPTACCDMILLVNTFHQLTDPIAYMKNVKKALKPDGKTVIIDHKSNDLFSEEALLAKVITEMRVAGYTLATSHGFLDKQFYLVFSDEEPDTK